MSGQPRRGHWVQVPGTAGLTQAGGQGRGCAHRLRTRHRALRVLGGAPWEECSCWRLHSGSETTKNSSSPHRDMSSRSLSTILNTQRQCPLLSGAGVGRPRAECTLQPPLLWADPASLWPSSVCKHSGWHTHCPKGIGLHSSELPAPELSNLQHRVPSRVQQCMAPH